LAQVASYWLKLCTAAALADSSVIMMRIATTLCVISFTAVLSEPAPAPLRSLASEPRKDAHADGSDAAGPDSTATTTVAVSKVADPVSQGSKEHADGSDTTTDAGAKTSTQIDADAAKAVAEKVATEKAAARKATNEKAAAEKAALEKAAAEKAALEKMAAEKVAAQKEDAARASAAKASAQQAVADKAVAERSAAEKASAEKANTNNFLPQGMPWQTEAGIAVASVAGAALVAGGITAAVEESQGSSSSAHDKPQSDRTPSQRAHKQVAAEVAGGPAAPSVAPQPVTLPVQLYEHSKQEAADTAAGQVMFMSVAGLLLLMASFFLLVSGIAYWKQRAARNASFIEEDDEESEYGEDYDEELLA